MIAVSSLAVLIFIAYLFVTTQLGATTHCHHNFSYYFVKSLIPCVFMPVRTGTRYALESKVVYSR
jgi:hypothetical protein